MAKAAVEMAAWDLAARQQGMALATLLGGTRERVEAGIALGIQESPQALARRAAAAVAEGYRRVKIKVAPGQDVAFAAAAREAVGRGLPPGPRRQRRLHPRRPAGAATSRCPAPGDAGATPRSGGPDAATPGSRRRSATSICLDESITSAARAADAIGLGAARIINIKPGRLGGHAAARAVHDLAQRQGVPVWCGGMLESGIGRAHNVALASLPGFSLPGDLSPSRRYWRRDVVDPEWTMAGGMLRVPFDRPGIGVEVDRDLVESLTVRRMEVEAGRSG